MVLYFFLQHMATGLNHSTKLMHFSWAESKVFIVFLYYVISGALELTTFSITTRNMDHDIAAAVSYFDCQKNGYNDTCSLDIKETSSAVSIAAFVFLMLFPAINLIYAVKYNDVKMILNKISTAICVNNTVSSTQNSTVQSSKL